LAPRVQRGSIPGPLGATVGEPGLVIIYFVSFAPLGLLVRRLIEWPNTCDFLKQT
jgi:hypothetical protein